MYLRSSRDRCLWLPGIHFDIRTSLCRCQSGIRIPQSMSKRKQIFSESAGPPAMLPPPALTCQRPETNRRDIVKESVCRVNFHLCKSYFRWTRREWNLKMHFRVHNCGTFSHCTIQSNVLRWHQITDKVGDQNGKV